MPIRIVARIEDNGLAWRLGHASQDVKQLAGRKVRAASFAVEKRIKIEMPVLTGRARASWGHWTPQDIVKPNEEARTDDTHWLVRDGGLTVEQGSNVPYIIYLNDGHSQQAPAGFIDKAADAGARELTIEIGKVLGEVL